MFGLSLGTCLSNLKSLALTVLELLAFNNQKLGGHVTLATPLFEKFLRGHVWTVHGNMHVKFEVRSFNRSGAFFIDQSAAHRHTWNENSICAIHSVHLAEIINLLYITY